MQAEKAAIATERRVAAWERRREEVEVEVEQVLEVVAIGDSWAAAMAHAKEVAHAAATPMESWRNAERAQRWVDLDPVVETEEARAARLRLAIASGKHYPDLFD